MTKKVVAPEVEQEEVCEMDEYGCVIKPIHELVTTKQPEAETAEEI